MTRDNDCSERVENHSTYQLPTLEMLWTKRCVKGGGKTYHRGLSTLKPPTWAHFAAALYNFYGLLEDYAPIRRESAAGMLWKKLSNEVKAHVNKARESAILAVETYNRPGALFRSARVRCLDGNSLDRFVPFHFLRAKVKPFYVKARRGLYVRYEKIDGDYKVWDLSECIQQYYKDEDLPLRKNLEFFVGLRNKIEHRSMPQLDDQIFGECQALLLNFEALLSKEYDDRYSLNGSLAVSLQFSTITPEGKARALRNLQSKNYPSVVEYVKRFRSGVISRY